MIVSFIYKDSSSSKMIIFSFDFGEKKRIHDKAKTRHAGRKEREEEEEEKGGGGVGPERERERERGPNKQTNKPKR